MFKSLVLLIWPLTCAGCDKPDHSLCSDCIAELQSSVESKSVYKEDSNLYLYAAAKYSNVVRNIILKWKDHGREDMVKYIVRIIQNVAAKWLEENHTTRNTRVIIVPAPSSPKNIKARGKLQTLDLAHGVAQFFQNKGVKSQVIQALKQSNLKKQVGVSGQARQSNKRNALKTTSKIKRLVKSDYAKANQENGTDITQRNTKYVYVLVDDICTTGSTLSACKRALNASGIEVSMCFTLTY